MTVPTDLTSALLYVVLVIPGFVFASVRGALRGPRGTQDIDLLSRLASALVYSLLFNSLYLVSLGLLIGSGRWSPSELSLDTLAASPVALGFLVLGLGLAFPAVWAIVLYYRIDWVALRGNRLPGRLRRLPLRPRRRGGYRNFPTAWGRAAPGLGGRYVRVRLPDGKWVGGWFSSASSVGTYPHGRDIFIEKQYPMKNGGRFGKLQPDPNGIWTWPTTPPGPPPSSPSGISK
ncbi:MAG: DUF6338 family protein [Protaetiibacter sp.]